MTPTRARHRPEPAGEPAPETIDPSPVPVEDVPEHATPAPEPQLPERDLDTIRAAFDAGGPEALRRGELDRMLSVEESGTTTIREQVTEGRLGVGALLRDGVDEPFVPVFGADRTPADDLVDDRPLSAPEALAEVMRRVQPIAKGRQADARVGGYHFRGIDDVYAALHDLFAEVGLVCLPSTLEREREQRPRVSGEGVNYVTHVRVRLRFLAQDGTSEELDGWGEGADTGDKSTGKAYSQAMKSALLAAFLIPTEASSADDPDASNSDASRPWTVEEQQRAETAYAAATTADTLDALVSVGRRAHAGGLLYVPVRMVDGTVAPLRVLLDARRAQLERQVQS